MSNKLQLSDKSRFDFLNERLTNDEHLFVHCQSQNENLDIPENLKTDETVTLKLSYFFRGRVRVFTDHVEASLSFRGVFYDCHIPLNAILACTTNKNETFIFPDEPENTLKEVPAKNKNNSNSKEKKKEKKVNSTEKGKRPTLKLVK